MYGLVLNGMCLLASQKLYISQKCAVRVPVSSARCRKLPASARAHTRRCAVCAPTICATLRGIDGSPCTPCRCMPRRGSQANTGLGRHGKGRKHKQKHHQEASPCAPRLPRDALRSPSTPHMRGTRVGEPRDSYGGVIDMYNCISTFVNTYHLEQARAVFFTSIGQWSPVLGW